MNTHDIEADRKRRGEPVSKIDPNPPQLSIVWHDSPESVDRAMWEQAAIEAGVTYEELIEGSNVGETEDGEVLEFTHEQAIDGMRTQGCWGFVDTKTNTINAWAADDVDAPTALHFLAHEIGHVTGEQLDDDMQEEMRAEQFGRVAALAYRLWCEKKNDAPQPAEPVKVPSDAGAQHVQDFINCDGMGAVIVEGPQHSAVVRALLARYSQPAKSSLTVRYDDKGDCLYVACDSNEPAQASEDEHGILRRHALSDGRLVGITIPNFVGRMPVASMEPSNNKENE